MKINQETFIEEFKKKGLEDELGGNEGLKALHIYLEELEENTGEQIALDPISLCVEFDHFSDEMEAMDRYDGLIENIEDLKSQANVIEFYGGQLLVGNF